MRRIVAMIPLVLLALACGAPEGGSGAQRPPRSPYPDEPVSSSPGLPDDDGGGPGYEVVEPQPGMVDVRPRPFERAKPSADGRTLTVIFWSGVEPCNVLDRVEVKETERAVKITLFEGSDPDTQNARCIEIAVKKAVRIELEEPLGERKIVDGAA